ncbi:MAG: AAA family ATPase [Actinobacteria bacterium]|nr:AAA family ATPase [Actinomycetota bacterium]
MLGHPTLLLEGRAVVGFSSLRMQRLLATLVLEPDTSVPRSRMAFQLWPESTEAQARTNLRKLLHELRQMLSGAGANLEVDQQELRWRAAPSSWVDVIAFQDALERGEDDAAVAIYAGDLLPDCYDDWVIEARDRLRQAAGGALDRLAAAAEDRGDHLAAIDHACARLRLDPWWEPAHRHLIRSHGRLGNRAEALRSYHRCAEVLAKELGVEPDPTTRRAYEAVRSPVSIAAAAPVVSSPSAVGRSVELDRMKSVWERATAWRSQLLLVTGDAGIGKSRLVDELARSVQSRAIVARSRAYEAAGRLPWGPVVEWLRSGGMEQARQRLAPRWRGELALLLPELRAETGTGTAHRRDGDPGARTQLFDAISHALLADDRPVLLVIDDLQWCDLDTIDLIGYLVSTRPSSPVLVAGTVRIDEVADDHPLRRLVTGLQREAAVTQLDLGPLDLAATSELVQRLTGVAVAPGALERLWRDTAGNPLFLVEAARAGLTGPATVSVSLLPTVKATIGARLARLSPGARALVELTAALGREFTADIVVRASEQEPQQVLDALDELWQRRIVRELGAGYDFTHDKIREVAYDGISPVRRRRLHWAAAQALLDAHGDDPGPFSAHLAAQLEAAGLVGAAVDAHRRAAEHAAAVFGLDEAIESCRRGLALLEQLPPGRDRDEQELRLRLALGAPVVALEGYGSALGQDVYGRTLALCRHLGRRVDPATLRGLGLAAVTSCQFGRAAPFGAELLAIEDDPIARTEGHYLLGVTAFWRGALESAEHHLRAAVSSYRPDLGPTHRLYYAQDPKAVCLVRLAVTRLWRGDAEEARELAEEARSFALSLDHPMTLRYVLLFTSMAAIELSDESWLRRDLSQVAAVAEHGLAFVRVVERIYEAWIGILDRREAALDELEAAVEACRVESVSLHLTHGLSILARAQLRLGRTERGLAAVREGLAWAATHDQHYTDPLLHRIEGELLEAQGDLAGAARAFDRARDVAAAQGANRFISSAVDGHSRVSVGLTPGGAGRGNV